MKRNDFIFLIVSLFYAITFVTIFIYQTLPEKSVTELSSVSTDIKTTGTATDIEKIKDMIKNKKLSDKEALFYQKLIEEEEKQSNQNKQQQPRRRQRRGRH